MNHDPFDSLRRRNPAPPEHLPEAPMAVARRITAGQPTLRRGLAIAVAAAAVALVAGGGWLLWSGTGDHPTAVAPPPTTTTTSEAAPTTTATSLPADEEVPIAVEDAPTIVVYFLAHDPVRGGGMPVPVARDLRVLNVRPLPDLGSLTMELLLHGPGAWDAGPLPDPVAAAEAGLTTAITEGTELRGLTIADGVATVDLAGLQGESRLASPEALAQIVFTLTRMEGVDGVRFLLEGEPHAVVAETLALVPAATPPPGSTLLDTITRTAFRGYLPLATIDSPALGGTLPLPGTITGVGHPLSLRVGLVLAGSAGEPLWETEVTTACGPPSGEPAGCVDGHDWSTFAAPVPAGLVADGQWGTLTMSLFDSEGRLIFRHSLPVWLEPSGLGALRPFPPEALTGCAADTARDVAAFEAALAEGPLSLEGLCARVGRPDWETGSGLAIAVYDLAEGSRLYLGYAGPQGSDLLYAYVVSPSGEERDLLEQ